jgi:hypothetical protein
VPSAPRLCQGIRRLTEPDSSPCRGLRCRSLDFLKTCSRRFPPPIDRHDPSTPHVVRVDVQVVLRTMTSPS